MEPETPTLYGVSLLSDETDWERLRAMTDADIERAVLSDPDAGPILSAEEMRAAYRPAPARLKR
jgi:hypothetical protein